MKNTITGIISIVGISIGFMSVAEASDRERGYYSEKRIVKKVRHNDERRWKYTDKHVRYQQPGHVYNYHDKHFRHDDRNRHDHRYVEKHVYKHKGPRFVEKHVYRNVPRRVEKRVYQYYQPVPRHHVVKKVIIKDRHHHHGNALPVIAGGLIGSAISSDLSHGDPVATFSGAIFGAMLGDALSHH